MTNPNAALDAILAPNGESDEKTIHALTIGRYALLELIKSPFLTGTIPSPTDVLPSMYIMMADAKDLAKYNSSNIDELRIKAAEWGMDLEVSLIPDFANYLVDEILRINRVSPEDVPKEGVKSKGKKLQTAG